MKTRTLEITIEQAEELLKTTPSLTEVIYNNFPELKPKPVVPNSWYDLGRIEGCFIKHDSWIDYDYNFSTESSKNIFATEKQALSALAYAQLTQLMKATGDCDVDWSNGRQIKYCISRRGNDFLILGEEYVEYQFMSFKTKKVRNEFVQKHKKLIRQFYQMD